MWSAGLAAGVAAGGPAALLLLWTLPVVVAELGTHVGSLGASTAAWLHWGDREGYSTALPLAGFSVTLQ